jgi:hypothetical protein
VDCSRTQLLNYSFERKKSCRIKIENTDDSILVDNMYILADDKSMNRPDKAYTLKHYQGHVDWKSEVERLMAKSMLSEHEVDKIKNCIDNSGGRSMTAFIAFVVIICLLLA